MQLLIDINRPERGLLLSCLNDNGIIAYFYWSVNLKKLAIKNILRGVIVDVTRIVNMAKSQGKSQAYLCRLIGKSQYYLQDVKKGRFNISSDALKTIADDLGTTPGYLNWETGDPNQTDFESPSADADVVIYRRDGKTTVRKLTPEQLRMFERLLDAVDDSNSDL